MALDAPTMAAWRLHGPTDLRYEHVPIPVPRPGEALVRVEACGVCSSDIERIFETGMYVYPSIPGHEFAGTVVSVGSSDDEEWVGKPVAIFPLIPCMECPSCEVGHYETCESYGYLGSRSDGGFAEYARVPVWNLKELPQGLETGDAALLEPVAVALHALRQAGSVEGRSLLVVGSGIIGILVAQWGLLEGARDVCVRGRSEWKRPLVESLGIGYEIESPLLRGRTHDVVFECVGTDEAINASMRAVGPEGRLVLVGNPKGDITIERAVWWAILRRQLSVVGSWNSRYSGLERSDWDRAIEALATGEIRVTELVGDRYPLDALDKALARLMDPEGRLIKVLVTMAE